MTNSNALKRKSTHWLKSFSPLTRISFPEKTVPLALLGTCAIAFGLVIPSLGYYVDDWHHIYFGYARGLPGLWDLFQYDGRPYAALFYYGGFNILGFKPWHWHVFSLVLRSLTVIMTWLYLKDIWPEHKRAVTWTALLFAIYPLFKQQTVSVAYSLHWLGYLLYSISIWAMVRSIRQPQRFWPYLVLALFTDGLQLLLLEYYAGIELIRPFIIWLLVSEAGRPLSQRVRQTLKLWSPYFLLLVAFIFYRIFLIPRLTLGLGRNAPALLFDLYKAPITTSTHLLQSVLQDTTAILYSAWHNVINPELFDITQSANLKAILIILLVGGTLWFYLTNLNLGDQSRTGSAEHWVRSALFLGILLTVLGPVPAWLTDQHISTDNPLWSDRFGLASMLGASLVVVAILEALVGNQKYRTILLCGLIGLSIGWHVLNGNANRWSWVKQSRFYWQLAWRAPYIEPNTAFLSDEEVLPSMTESWTSFALSTLYPKPDDALPLNYWFFSVSRRFGENLGELTRGMPLRYVRNSAQYSGNSLDSLVIDFKPEENACLWVVRPEDREIRVLPDLTRKVAAISNLDRIKIDSPYERPVPAEIFGVEPAPTWCYYFEKSDLARQFGDWERVVALWQEAAEKGFEPGNGVEYLPFIEGFTRTGDWGKAAEMTITANKITHMMAPSLCATWKKVEQETQPSDMRAGTLANIYSKLKCP